MSNIAQVVVEIIVEKLGILREDVTSDAAFIRDLGADDLAMVELIMEFERTLGIPIPDDVAEKIETVADAISYLEANKSKAKF